MMCQCLSRKDYQSHTCNTMQQLGQNMVANVASGRTSSACVSLQVSTETTFASSNISCDRIHQRTDTTLVSPPSSQSEQIVSPALNCNVASQPLEDDKSRMPDNNQLAPRVREHDTNFTDINSYICETNLRRLTPREVFQHNNLVGWNEWSIHKSNIYHNGKVNNILFQLLVDTSKTRADKQHVDANLDDSYPNNGCRPEFNLESTAVWNTNVIQALLTSELDEATVEKYARLCCVGNLVRHTDAKYYEDLRYDIERLLHDLIRESCEGTITVYTKDYMQLLQRWMKTCRSLHLENSRLPVGDINECRFPLPEDVQQNPECLRSWVEDWERFDFSIPVSGAWVVIEADKVDLVNTHEIYLSTLRSHIDLTPFDTTIDGEAAWRVIPEDLFAKDIMTEEQRLTESERIKCKHFLDPERMERRRQDILQYFTDKYKYNIEKVNRFSYWADSMKHGEAKFIHLCNLS